MEAFRLTSRVRAVSRAATQRASVLSVEDPVPGPVSVPSSVSEPVPVPLSEPVPVPVPVPVPWKVTARSTTGVIEIEHRGAGPLRAVRLTLAGGGLLGLSLPRTVYPGERLRVVVRGVYASDAITAPDAMLVLRWFEPDGRELLWPIAL